MNGKQWFRRFGIASAALLLLLALLAAIVDPFMQYRVRDNTYYINARFVNPGIIKNGDYDAVVIGSSLVQNFNMQSFRDKLGVDPIKATEGGLSRVEMLELSALIDRRDRAKTYFYCINVNMFAEWSGAAQRSFPVYLTDDDLANDYRYLLGYETWMRYMPVDLVFLLCDALGITLPDAVIAQRSIDKMEDFSDKFPCGKEYLMEQYVDSHREPFNAASSLRSQEALNEEINVFFDTLAIQPDKTYMFFFPPLSALYWYSQDASYADALMQCKKTVVNRLAAYENVTVFDFQSMPEIADLDHYMDVSHYSSEINEKMIDCFRTGEYAVNSETIADSIERQCAIMNAFYAENVDWLD